jgi:hypothetical protein
MARSLWEASALRAQSALAAIVARYQGEFDNYYLMKCGPLSTDRTEDMARIARDALASESWLAIKPTRRFGER